MPWKGNKKHASDSISTKITDQIQFMNIDNVTWHGNFLNFQNLKPSTEDDYDETEVKTLKRSKTIQALSDSAKFSPFRLPV